MKNRRYRGMYIAGLMAILLGVSGCGQEADVQTVFVNLEEYPRESYSALKIERQDFVPRIEVSLACESMDKMVYNSDGERRTIKKFFVAEGDVVHEGDILFQYDVDDVQKELNQVESELSKLKINLDHIERMNLITKSDSLKTELEQTTRSISAGEMKRQELLGQIEKQNVRAKGTGMVVEVTETMEGRELVGNQRLLKVVYSNGGYKGNCKEAYDFQLGNTYGVVIGNATYDMKLTEMEEKGDGTIDITLENNLTKEEFCVWDNVNLFLQKEMIPNAMVVPKSVVHYTVDEGRPFVYVLNEEHHRDVAYVTLGDTINEYVVIADGVEEGSELLP